MEQLTNEAVLEGNEIIANFWCGWKLGELFKYPTHGGQGYVAPDELKFHSSWDWLIPCVEKIRTLNYVVELHFVDDCYAKIYNANMKLITESINPEAIVAAWEAVVQLINGLNIRPTISSTPTNGGK